MSFLQMPLFQTAFAVNNPAFVTIGSGTVISFFKLLFVVLALLYLLFAFVVTRQIKVMRTTLITPISPLVRVIGYAHLLFALVVFVGFLLFL